jgi:hypothetical protein
MGVMGLLSWLRKDKESKSPSAELGCVPHSLVCAWAWGQTYHVPVRIAVQAIKRTAKESRDHAQAEALVGSKWVPLTLLWIDRALIVVTYKRHYPDIEPYRYLGLREWIEEQIQFTDEVK